MSQRSEQLPLKNFWVLEFLNLDSALQQLSKNDNYSAFRMIFSYSLGEPIEEEVLDGRWCSVVVDFEGGPWP